MSAQPLEPLISPFQYEFEKEFDIQIPDDQAENIVSVGQAIEFIEKAK